MRRRTRTTRRLAAISSRAPLPPSRPPPAPPRLAPLRSSRKNRRRSPPRLRPPRPDLKGRDRRRNMARGGADEAQQIVARGPQAAARAAEAAIDGDPLLGSVTYSIIAEDEARGVWRIDAFPTAPAEAERLIAVLADHPGLATTSQTLADADWLAMALSGLPPVRAGRFFVFGAHDRGRAPASTVNLRIEAGAAFGTGHHGTTVGCLIAFDALLKRSRFARVLD